MPIDRKGIHFPPFQLLLCYSYILDNLYFVFANCNAHAEFASS